MTDAGSLGTIVADEVILPIVSIGLAGGKLRIVAERLGPLRVDLRDAEARVHDPDGNLVCVASAAELGVVDLKADGSKLVFTLDLAVNGKATDSWRRRTAARSGWGR